MTIESHDEADARVDALVASLSRAEPPAQFSERVVDVHLRRRALTTRALQASALAAAAMCGALAMLAVTGAGDADDVSRVAISTPAGTLEGARFTADVMPLEESMLTAIRPFPKSLATAAAGAVVGAGLAVAVQSGALTVANDHGSVQVGPGQVAAVVAGQAPVRSGDEARPVDSVARLREENEGLRQALEAARAASSSGGDVQRLVTENQQLRDKLRAADEELRLFDEVRKNTEGEARPFPKDLAPRFAEQALQQAFDDAMNEMGIEGGVIEIDCAEYPCVVYGQLTSKHDMDKLRESKALAAYGDDEDRTSVWHSTKKKDGKKVESAYFAVAFSPRLGEKYVDDELNKRTSHRMQTTADRLIPRGE